MNEVDQRLSMEFERDAEWKAYQARVARILTKRNGGRPLTIEESAILADYKVACALTEPPRHVETGAILPPILYGYGEAEDAFPVDRAQLLGLRSQKCPAFTGNIILTATLSETLKANPSPHRLTPGLVHTGRKPKLTPEIQGIIVQSLETCPVLEHAAGAAGITSQTLANWRAKGEAGVKRYVDFFGAVEAALESARHSLVRDIATDPDWRAKLAILERTMPEKWGRKTAHEHSGPGGGPIKTDGPPPLIITLAGDVANTYDTTQPPEPAHAGAGA